VLIQFYQFHSQ